MLKSDESYKSEVMKNIYDVYNQGLLPPNHYRFLEFLHGSLNFEPLVIFDILVVLSYIGKDMHREYGLVV